MKTKTVRWKDICHTMKLMGMMQDFSKAECLRIAKLVKVQVKAGKARKLKRGLYEIIK